MGGAANSFHLRGRAADLVPVRSQKAALIRFLWSQRIGASCTGPEELLDEGDHVHVAW